MLPKSVATNSPKTEPGATATQGSVLRLFGFLAVGWLPALIDAGALSEATALNVLAESPQPYFVPSEAWLLGEWLQLKFLWHEDYLMRWAFLVFPLVVYWRSDVPGRRGQPRLFLVATAAAGLVALYLSLPPDATPGHHARRIGSSTEIRLGGYEPREPAALRRGSIMGNIVPYPAHHLVPKRSFGEAPSVLYPLCSPKRDQGDINYVLQAVSSPIPNGMQVLAVQGDVALYVKDRAVLAEHRAKRPPTPAGSSLYVVPRRMLYQKKGPPLRELFRSVLGRPGVER